MSWALFRSKTNFGKEEENKDELKRLTKISNKAHLIEVCTESSLQPLVQFFIIFSALLPNDVTSDASNTIKNAINLLLEKNWAELGLLLERSNITLQLWSFLTSVGSVAWSFQSNYARNKFGHMSITSRAVYFLYVLLAVLARITIIILFLLTIQESNESESKHNQFLGIYIILGIHMSICAGLELWLNWKRYTQKKHWLWKARDGLLKAFSSVYIYHPTEDGESEDLRMHVSIDALIFVQYVFFTGVIGSNKLVSIIWGGYLSAVLLKMAFYFGLHPWAEVVRKEIGSWTEPKAGLVIGPRKWTCFAFCVRFYEGMLYEWTICNNGATLTEKEKDDDIDNEICTFNKTDYESYYQHFYKCNSCNEYDVEVCCIVCADVCHAGHDIKYYKYTNSCCDCGSGILKNHGKMKNACQALTQRLPSPDRNNVEYEPASSPRNQGDEIFVEIEEDEEAAKLLPESTPFMPNSEPGQEWIPLTRTGMSEPKNSDETVIDTQDTSATVVQIESTPEIDDNDLNKDRQLLKKIWNIKSWN